MLKVANRNARYCYTRALAAKERALETKNPEDRVLYFEAEARWLKLAEGYDISAQSINSSQASPLLSVHHVQYVRWPCRLQRFKSVAERSNIATNARCAAIEWISRAPMIDGPADIRMLREVRV
jgi:hypothetical protein